MKCPECGGELYKLPNNPKRMRCRVCSAVFDTNQIDRLYGLKSGDKVHTGVASFETQNMHQKHLAGGAGSGYSNAVKEPTTVSLESGFGAKKAPKFQDDDLRSMASQMISRAGNQQTPRPASQYPNQQKQTNPIKIIIIVFVVIFSMSFLSTCVGALFEIFEDIDDIDGNVNITNTNRNYTHNTRNTNSNANQSANTNSNVNQSSNAANMNGSIAIGSRDEYVEGVSETDLYACNPTATVTYVKDKDRTIALVDVAWTNESGWHGSTFTTIDIECKQDGTEAEPVYYVADKNAGYNDNLKYDYVEVHENGHGQYVFYVDPVKPVTVELAMKSDTFDYANPPLVVLNFDTAATAGTGKAVSPK